MKELDILAFGSHPDDVELGCGGTLALHASKGYKTGIVDLTQGELGTRGTIEIRTKESESAAVILQASVRLNTKFEDGFFLNDKKHQLEIVKVIRQYRPKIVFANAHTDRHPDHGRGSQLVSDSCFLAGLEKIHTEFDGEEQKAWRPKSVYHYIQYRNQKPDIVVDISDYFEVKMDAVKAHRSQFYDATSTESETLISKPEFLEYIKGNALDMGKQIGVRYAEGFTVDRYIGTNDLLNLL